MPDAVDLQGKYPASCQSPHHVQVTATAGSVTANNLPLGLGKTTVPAEADDVDLAERLRPAPDVGSKRAHQACPAHRADLIELVSQPLGPGESLLYGSRKHPTCATVAGRPGAGIDGAAFDRVQPQPVPFMHVQFPVPSRLMHDDRADQPRRQRWRIGTSTDNDMGGVPFPTP